MIAYSKPVIFDTHVWFWLAIGDSELVQSSTMKRLIDELHRYQLNISAITHWEISMLEAKGRITLKLDCLNWLSESIRKTKIHVVDLTPEISVTSNRLPGNFHGDPADRIIVATARLINGILLTRDDRILRYGSEGFVDTLKV